MDPREIANQVYALAAADPANQPLAPMVKEALDVIDQSLDTHGYAPRPCTYSLSHLFNAARITSRSASMEEKIVRGLPLRGL